MPSTKPEVQRKKYQRSEALTAAKAHELFSIKDGVLFNRVDRGTRAFAGKPAGCANGDGYICLKVGMTKYKAHRIIWLMTFGCWPVDQLDHINGVRDDNRIENLREVSCQGNQRNQRRRIDNVTGVTGVTIERGAWCARIKVDGKKIRLGRFHSKDEAIAARKAAEALHGFHPNHGATEDQRRLHDNMEAA